MNITQVEDKAIKTKAWVFSIITYAILLLSLYFIKIAYNAPEEEVGFGVDLNYGVDLVGSGDLQTTNKANASKENFDAAPESGKKELPAPQPEISKPQPVKNTPKAAPAKVLTADEDTKVKVKTAPVADKSKATPAPKTVVNNPIPAKPVETPQPQRTVDNGSIMKKSSGSGGNTGTNGTTGTKVGVGGNNNGDGKPGEVGDKGDPRGTLDGKSLYGNPGSGGNGAGGNGGSSGTSVNISGWKNKGNLNISKDNSSETGTIIFDVVINDFGDVVTIKNRATSLSPSVVNYYRDQIKAKLKSTLQAEGTPPSRSSGTITIRIIRGS